MKRKEERQESAVIEQDQSKEGSRPLSPIIRLRCNASFALLAMTLSSCAAGHTHKGFYAGAAMISPVSLAVPSAGRCGRHHSSSDEEEATKTSKSIWASCWLGFATIGLLGGAALGGGAAVAGADEGTYVPLMVVGLLIGTIVGCTWF